MHVRRERSTFRVGDGRFNCVGYIRQFSPPLLTRSSAATQKSAQAHTLLPSWVSVWQSASRAVTSPSLSRTACHLMDILLKLEIVPFTAVSDTIQSMLLSIEMTGPSSITDSSSSLLTTIMRERMKENPTHFNHTAERILSWLFSKWTPSRYAILRM